MSIRVKYEAELGEVYDSLIKMCRQVEQAIEKSVAALVNHDAQQAKAVIEGDKNINLAERAIEMDCLKILLMEHPVAGDFRDVSAALKMITDLERIGDQAADISALSLQLSAPVIKEPKELVTMARTVTSMVKDGVASYINRDVTAAKQLEKRDDAVDDMFNAIKHSLVEYIKLNPDAAEQAMLFMMIAKYLERIGDHAVNLGEWAEYAATGVHNLY